MKILNLIFAAILITGCNMSETNKKTEIQPPDPDQIPKELVSHGDVRIDNYYWMKLTDEQKNSENPDDQTQKVVTYLEAENEYQTRQMAHTENLQETLYNEIVGRIKQTDNSVPYLKNGYWYYTRYEEGKEYPIYCRKKGSLESQEQIMIDVNDYGENHEFVSISGLRVSPNNKYLSFGLDTVSRRLYTIMVKDLETGEMLSDIITNSGGSAAWANNNKTFFYVQKDANTLRSQKIFRHQIGTPESADIEVYYDPALFKGLEYGKHPLAPLLRNAMETQQVIGEYFVGDWRDIGTPERLEELDMDLNKLL